MHHLLAHGATARARATVVSAPTSELCHAGSTGGALQAKTRTLVDLVVHMSRYNCSLPELGPDGKEIPGKYGELCQPWDEAAWAPAMRPLAPLVRANSPSGIAGNNFMCVCGQFERLSQLFHCARSLHLANCCSQGGNTSTSSASARLRSAAKYGCRVVLCCVV